MSDNESEEIWEWDVTNDGPKERWEWYISDINEPRKDESEINT